MIDQGTTNSTPEESESSGARQRAIEAYEGARERAVDTLG